MAVQRKKYVIYFLLFLILAIGGGIFIYLEMQDRARQRSPFSAIRWEGSIAHVKHEGNWYRLKAINDISSDMLVRFAQQQYGVSWQPQIEDSLTHVLTLLNGYPGKNVVLVLVSPDGGAALQLTAEMTIVKRDSVRYYRETQLRKISRMHQVFTEPGTLDSLAVDSMAQFSMLKRRIDGFRPPAGWQAQKLKTPEQRIQNPPQWLSRAQAEADLDQLEWFLVNKYAYLNRKNIDYQKGLDVIRSHLEKGISRRDFALQLKKFLALFGDEDTFLPFAKNKLVLPGAALPFILKAYKNQVAALMPEQTAFWQPEHPLLSQINGEPLENWLSFAMEFYGNASSASQRNRAASLLRQFNFINLSAGNRPRTAATISLDSPNGTATFVQKVSLTDQMPKDIEKKKTTGFLTDSIAYLPLAEIDNWQAAEETFAAFMKNFSQSKGLIIDMRNSQGNGRLAVKALLPFFLKQDKKTQILEIAALRIDATEDPRHPEGYLQKAFLYPANAVRWASTEKKVIDLFAQDFDPEWPLPAGQFSEWHYLTSRPAEAKNYYDSHVIVLMNERRFKAADIFLTAVKKLENITLLGTPGSSGDGLSDEHYLNNSGLCVQLSKAATFRPDGKLYGGRSIHPDILHYPTLEDLIGKTDSMKQSAINLLKQQHIFKITRR